MSPLIKAACTWKNAAIWAVFFHLLSINSCDTRCRIKQCPAEGNLWPAVLEWLDVGEPTRDVDELLLLAERQALHPRVQLRVQEVVRFGFEVSGQKCSIWNFSNCVVRFNYKYSWIWLISHMFIISFWMHENIVMDNKITHICFQENYNNMFTEKFWFMKIWPNSCFCDHEI